MINTRMTVRSVTSLVVGLFLVAVSLPAFSYVLTKVCANLDNELSHLMKIYQAHGVI